MRKKGGKLKKTLSKEFQKTFFVEVKENGDFLSPYQVECLMLLKKYNLPFMVLYHLLRKEENTTEVFRK